MSRHADRQELAREFGATDIVETRGDDEGLRDHDDCGAGQGVGQRRRQGSTTGGVADRAVNRMARLVACGEFAP